MSYLRILDDVDMDGLKQLVHSRLIEPVTHTAFLNTSLCVRVTVEGDFYRRINKVYELRISKSFVRGLVEQLTQGFNHHAAAKISLLYRTGLGLPQNKECHLIWEEIAGGNSVKVNDRIFTYSDMVRVLVAHWKQIADENIDPYWLYFNPQNDYFKKLLEPSFPKVINKDYLKTKKPLYVFPRYEGLDCSIVYRLNSEGRAVLYSAHAKINKKLLNITAQILTSNAMPNVLPEGSVPESFGPFIIFNGVLTIKKSDQKKLKKEWLNQDVNNLIRSCLEQDTMSLPDYLDVKVSVDNVSSKFVRQYKANYKKATDYLIEAKTKRLTKSVAARINKAQKLVDAYEEHLQVIEEGKQEFNRLKDLDIVACLCFIGFDTFGYKDSKIRKFTNAYSTVHTFMKGLGIVVPKLEKAKSKTVNKLQEQAKDLALRNFTYNGLICRVSENGSNDPLTWVKFKF